MSPFRAVIAFLFGMMAACRAQQSCGCLPTGSVESLRCKSIQLKESVAGVDSVLFVPTSVDPENRATFDLLKVLVGMTKQRSSYISELGGDNDLVRRVYDEVIRDSCDYINGRYNMSIDCVRIVEAEEVEFQKIEELLKKLTIVEAILNINHVLERTNPLDVSLPHAQ